MSFFHGFGKAMFYAGIFVAGYAVSSCVNTDIRYDVTRYDKKPFLVDKKQVKELRSLMKMVRCS